MPEGRQVCKRCEEGDKIDDRDTRKTASSYSTTQLKKELRRRKNNDYILNNNNNGFSFNTNN